MVSAQSLDRDDLALPDEAACQFYGVEPGIATQMRIVAIEPDQAGAGSAIMAGDRFGVEPAIGRIAIFRPACLAHREPGHGGVAAIIGNVPDDAEARTAMGAAGERMAEAPFPGIGNFLRAGPADCRVRRDLGMCFSGQRAGDAESRRQIAGKHSGFDAVDSRQGRSFAPDARDEIVDRAAGSADPQQDAVGVVQNLAAKPEIPGKTPDRRAKPDTLHTAAHANFHRDIFPP